MSKGYEDHGGVTVSPTVALHGLDQPPDLALGEMLPRSIFGIGFAPGQSGWRRSHCELFVVRGDQSQVRSGGHFHLLRLANCAFKEPSIRCRPAVIYYARNRANPSVHPASTAPSGPSMKFCQLGAVLQEVGLKRCWRGPKSCCVKVVRLKGKYVRSPANRPPSRRGPSSGKHPNIRTSHPLAPALECSDVRLVGQEARERVLELRCPVAVPREIGSLRVPNHHYLL